jgi:hypothetical protein
MYHSPGGIFRSTVSTLEIPEGERNRGDLGQHFYSVNLVAVAISPELKNKIIAFPLAQTVIHRATSSIRIVAKAWFDIPVLFHLPK